MQKTKELIQRYYDYFNRKDIAAFLDLLDENVIHDINQNGQEIGKKVFADFMQRMECYEENVKDLVIMVNEDGTRAAAEFLVVGRYVKTDISGPEAKGQHYRLPCGAFFDIKNGKIARVTVYYNLQDWLKQVENK